MTSPERSSWVAARVAEVRGVRDPLLPLARWLGWTSGQVWTAGLAVVGAALLLTAALPPAFSPAPRAAAAATGVEGLTVGGGPAPGVAGVGGRAGGSGAGDSPAPPLSAAGGVLPPDGSGSGLEAGATTPQPPALSGQPISAAGPSVATPGVARPVPSDGRTTPVAGSSAPPVRRGAARPAAPEGPGRTGSPTAPTLQGMAPTRAPALGGALTIRESGWATGAGAGAPASAVPPGRLPVGAAQGQPGPTSFARLAGAGATLRLALDAPPAAGAPSPEVALCPVDDATWQPGPAQRQPPAYPDDAARCVPGVADVGGAAVTFDLGRYDVATRTGQAGFVLVRRPGSTATFTATFQESTA